MMMENVTKPSILVIDDEPDGLRDQVALQLDDRALTHVVHPNDVQMRDLQAADLVLVDYRLDRWPERDAQSTVSLQPATGTALAVVLREQVDRSQTDGLTAFGLHTGHLHDIQGRLPAATAQHVLARLNNLEWVFTKSGRGRYEQMVCLADAVRGLSENWPSDSRTMAPEAKRLLGMSTVDDSSERCWLEVLDCRVPIRELTPDGHGIRFVRWLLHQVLPYPCFLWEEHWAAARLGISVGALRDVVNGNSRLAKDLKSMQYSGILAEFLGKRWWRGALEDYVWDLAGGRPAKLQKTLTERSGRDLDLIDANPAVVCLDKDLVPTGQFVSPTAAVTLRPDQWPPFADSAWTDIEAVLNEPTLLSMMDPLDLHRAMHGDE